MSKMNLHEIEDIYPVSERQATWLRAPQITGGNARCTAELGAGPDREILQQAWQRLVAGHPILRGSFVWRRVAEPLLVIRREVPTQIHVHDASQPDVIVTDFDLARAPLWRVEVRQQAAQGFRLDLSYHRLLLDEASAQLLLTELRRGYDALRQGREFTPAGELPCQWNDTATEYPRAQTISELFEAQAALTPDAVALRYPDAELSYAELNRRANRLAHYLRSVGVTAETCVGICLERSAELIVALLATLKAGGVYLPLDPEQPLERLAFMLDDAQAPVVITREAELERMPAHWGQVICLDSDAAAIAQESAVNPVSLVTAENLAYVNYTSGSTGQPKGIGIPHRAVVRLVRQTNYIQFASADVVAQVATPSFDAATFEIWGALLNGARLVGFPKDILLAPPVFAAQLREQGVSVLFLTTALFNQIAQVTPDAFASLRYLLFGGDAAAPRWVREVLLSNAPAHLLNAYGPTESTTFAAWHEVSSLAADAAVVPIGRPLSNTELYLLDENLRPVPAGVVGELHIGGDGLARAYLNRPTLTAEKFIPHPFSQTAGARLYKTGDWARYNDEGHFEFLGRRDQQVKLRGYRIELGEIETILRQHAAVRDAVVVVREEQPGEKQLVAYVVAAAPGEVAAATLRSHLQRHLPEYMVPALFVSLKQLPVTLNGKVDRRALPAPEIESGAAAPSQVVPETQLEQALAEIWAAVLGRSSVGVTENFFEAGGDSIRSIQVVARAQARGIALEIQDLFQHQTIRTLAVALADRRADEQPPSRVEPFSLLKEEDRLRLSVWAETTLADAYPLTRLQSGMLFHSEYQPGDALYLDVLSYHLRAPFDVAACRAALQALTDRHAVLRTAFDLAAFSEPMQLVRQQITPILQVEDLSALPDEEQERRLNDWVAQEKQNPFDWRQAPLIRFALHRRGADRIQFSFSFHHSILDGWSETQMLREFFGLYYAHLGVTQAYANEPLAVTYADFVALERAALIAEEPRAFWRETLHDAPLTTLPHIARITPQQGSERRGRLQTISLTPALVRGLKASAEQIGVPLKSVLLAAHLKVLGLLAGQTEVVTGLVTNGRPETADGERLLGLFLNTVPLRVALSQGAWAELARAAAAAERELLPYRRFPLAEMQRVTGRPVLYETVFNFIHFHAFAGVLESQQVTLLDSRSFTETNFPFIANFNLDPATDVLQIVLHYDAARLPDEQAEALAGYYLRALTALATHPATPHHTADLLSTAERNRLLRDVSATAQHYPQACRVHELFEQQAARTPTAVAVEAGEVCLSYQELNARANRIAQALRARGVAAETSVGICLPRSADAVAAVLGVFKAGGAYVPLDANWPPERLAYVLRDAGVELLLTHTQFAERLKPLSVACLFLDDTEVLAACESHHPGTITQSANLAYVIYTSGSTGQPKGVAVEHRQLVNYLCWFNQFLSPEPPLLPLTTSLSFDASLKQLLAPLLRGARVWVLPDDTVTQPAALARALCQKNNVGLNCVPALWDALLSSADVGELRALRASLTHLFIGGEQFSRDLIARTQQHFPALTIINLYGPTETTANASAGHIANATDISLGPPLANTQLYVLDEALNLVPEGVAGELYIGGDGVARGYRNRPELTAERFLPDPYGVRAGGRLYKTGDLVRRLASGRLEFLGRNDHQVKVRGFRIELGEIESVFREHAAVEQCVVLARQDAASGQADGQTRLVAYVVTSRAATWRPEELRQYAAQRLPDYMLPAVFVRLEQLPRNTHGKLDRRALMALGAPTAMPQAFVAPRTATETKLAEIWAAVLECDRIGVHDNFFALGGHSLNATQVVARIRAAFACELPLRQLFEAPTIAALATQIEQRLARETAPADLEQMLAEISQLSEHEIERLLSAERAAGKGGAD